MSAVMLTAGHVDAAIGTQEDADDPVRLDRPHGHTPRNFKLRPADQYRYDNETMKQALHFAPAVNYQPMANSPRLTAIMPSDNQSPASGTARKQRDTNTIPKRRAAGVVGKSGRELGTRLRHSSRESAGH